MRLRARRIFAPVRALFAMVVFVFKVYPMVPSRLLDWVTPQPMVERVRYPASGGFAEGDLYRPRTGTKHPGILVCLGVVPFGVEHPQVPRLGEALARSGFAALLYWSPAMRDYRLDPVDVSDITLAYEALVTRDDVDAERSGLLGTCVGGAFALMAASDGRIRDRVAFILAYAPYASMWTLARDIASATRPRGETYEPWAVDPLARKVYVHSVTALLPPDEAEVLRNSAGEVSGSEHLSPDAQVVMPLLAPLQRDEADLALRRLPPELQERLTALSPLAYIEGIRSPLVVLLHDRDDAVIPVAERARAA